MYAIASAGLSDIGRKRQSNQDHFLVDDANGLYLVADGMGGHQAGEVAARLVVEAMQRYYSAGTPSSDGAGNGSDDPALSGKANQLLRAVRYANEQVYRASIDNEAYKGMGSTLAAVQFAENTFVAANVGDSPIYLIHEGSIEMLSVPHTLMAEQAEFDADPGLFGPELQHVLTRGMGVEASVQPDICESPCFGGDRLVMCSDGLSGKVTPEEILAVVNSESAPDACQSLVGMANRRGGDDNITVIVLHVDKASNLLMRLNRWVSRLAGSGPSDV